MKWFKHDSNSIHEAKIEKLIQKYGIEGYGLYYACIELIAQRLSGENVDFELHHDAETLAVKFKIDTLRVEEIIKFCVKEDLFQYSMEAGKIFCMRLLEMLDVSTSQNPDIKRIKSDKNYKKLLESNSRLDKIRLDNNTSHPHAQESSQQAEIPPSPFEDQDPGKALHGKIKSWFYEKNSDYHHDGRQAKAISSIIKRCEGNENKSMQFLNTYYHAVGTGKEKFWSESPMTPAGALSKWDYVIAKKKKKTESIYPEV